MTGSSYRKAIINLFVFDLDIELHALFHKSAVFFDRNHQLIYF